MSDTLRFDLSILLPDVPDARDACVERLTGALNDTAGVERAHVVPAENGIPDQVCIHYDPGRLAPPRLRHVAEQAGTRITGRYGHAAYHVTGLNSRRRARTIMRRLRRIVGVLGAEADAGGPLRVTFDRERLNEKNLCDEIRRLGLSVQNEVTRSPNRDHGSCSCAERAVQGRPPEDVPGLARVFGERTELIFAVISGLLVFGALALTYLAGAAATVTVPLYVTGYVFGGLFAVREAIDGIRGGYFDIDFLMVLAAAGAASLGAWFEGGLLLFLFSLGHALERLAMGRARAAVESLADLAPETAHVVREGVEEEVLIDRLRVGDLVRVRPDERLPADGFVTDGESAVNQAPVTGESVPINKRPVRDPEAALGDPQQLDAAHRVFAGTLNGSSALTITVTKPAGESTLDRVVRMVMEAQTERSPTQRFAARFERTFVPAVLVFIVLLLLVPAAFLVIPGLGPLEPFGASFYRAMAVLVAASPCALAISTPSAVLAGVARAGNGGVLIKGGGPLEILGNLSALAFDKTGTLTEGRPRVTDIEPADGVSEAELLRTVVAAETLSDHPLAQAVVRDLAERAGDVPEASDLESVTGHGVRAVLDGETVVRVGKAVLFERDEVTVPTLITDTVERLRTNGRSTMIVGCGDRILGVIGLMDTPRTEASAVLDRLRSLGIRRTVMLSGDGRRVAEAVAREVGIDEAHGDLLPEDKVATIKQLRETEGQVAMVGDGVNDAPAMAHAGVGIAMGAAGSDVALETADVALMGDHLARLPFAIGLSRKTRRIIRQNLFISLGVIALLVPLTLFGLDLSPAVIIHEGSTLVVVANALRLLHYQEVV